MVRVVLVAVLLMQCCNAIMAARLLEGDLGSWLQGQGGVAGELILQVLDKGGSPGVGNGCTQAHGAGGQTCYQPPK
uniref:Secreted protein n=1 Tax=Oryza punctata TaxID=4537 RepID=A0A0E0K961_ORYPU